MSEVKKSGLSTWGGVVILLMTLGLGIWGYTQIFTKYEEVRISNAKIQSLLEQQTERATNYARELELYKENFHKTEDLLSKVQDENNKLREKLVLLDQLDELQATVARLKEKNALMINHMSSVKKQEPDFNKSIQNVAEGRKILSKYGYYISDIKNRISVIKREERRQTVARQKEEDRLKLLAGNNGYVIRDGETMPREIVLPLKEKKDVTIDVTFVK